MDPQCSTSGVTEERESHFLGVYDKDDIGGAIKYVKGEKLFYDLYIVYAWSFDIYRYTNVNIFFNVKMDRPWENNEIKIHKRRM